MAGFNGLSQPSRAQAADIEGVAALVATSAITEQEAREIYPAAVADPSFDSWVGLQRDTLADISQTCATPAPDTLRDRVLSDIPNTPQEKRRTGRFVALAAAAAIIAGTGLWATQFTGEEEPQVYAANVAEGTVRISVKPGSDTATIELTNVPPPPEGKVYQMWVGTTEGAQSLGFMGPNDVEEHTEVSVEGFQNASEFMITAEDGGAAPAPSDPLVTVSLN